MNRFFQVLAIAQLALALVELPHHARGGIAGQLARHQQGYLASAQKLYVELPLDHDDPSAGTFQNKIYQDVSQWDGDGPCILLMGQEGPLGGIGDGFEATLAQNHKAMLVAMEHRFYGESMPAGGPAVGLNLTNLQYLTTKQALADAAAIVAWVSQKNTSCGCEWFAIGGSYSGALSAWFKAKYPDVITGALSSSGVVNAVYEFTAFDEQVATALGSTCAAAVRGVTAAFEGAVAAGGAASAQAKALFGCREDMLAADFFYMLADSAAMAAQYGHKADLCTALATGGAHPTPATLMALFANFTNSFWGPSFGTNCFYDTECLRDDPSHWQPTSRSWRWQKCSELAYFQIAPAKDSLRSQLINLTAVQTQCLAIFGQCINNTDAANTYYGGATPNVTQVFFSDFSDDPWQQASVKKSLSDSAIFKLVECNGCGHCDDLGAPSAADPENLTKERTEFESYFVKWMGK